ACPAADAIRDSIVTEVQTDAPGVPATFDFSGNLNGTIGDGQQVGPKPVKPGSYSTTEDVPAGWDLTKIKCSDSDSSGDLGTATASYNVAAGEDVTCTYTDSRLPTIKVKKVRKSTGLKSSFDLSGYV